MSSLHAHLQRHDLAVSLAFRRDCPVCRAERVQGQLPDALLASPRACAAMTAAVLATGAVAPGALAAADRQGLAAPAPASPPPPRLSDVAVGAGGAAPVDGDHPPGQEPAHAGDHGREGAGPSDDAREPQAGSGVGAPGRAEGSGSARPAGPRGGRSAASGDAASAHPATAQPARDGAPGERPDAPDRPPDPPAPAAAPQRAAQPARDRAPAARPDVPTDTPRARAAAPAPALARDDVPATAPSQSELGSRHARSSSDSPAASSPTAGAQRSGRSGKQPASRSARHPSPQAPALGRDAGARDAGGGSGRAERAQRARERRMAETTGAGSDAPTQGRAERPTTEPTTYRVRAGDSLWRIAARRLGPHATATATAWEVTRLWELNRQRIGTGDPDLIFPGQTLRM